MTTVRQAVLDLLRAEGVDTVFGNPGSTELTLLQDWPNDLRHLLGLQEATVVTVADGYAQGTARVLHMLHVDTEAGFAEVLAHALEADGPWVINAAVDPSFGVRYSAARPGG